MSESLSSQPSRKRVTHLDLLQLQLDPARLPRTLLQGVRIRNLKRVYAVILLALHKMPLTCLLVPPVLIFVDQGRSKEA